MDNVFEAAKSVASPEFQKKGIEKLRTLVLDWGQSGKFDEGTIFVVKVNGSFIAMNKQNMGNFMYGMTFQRFGYSKEQAQALGQFWNILHSQQLDSKDDQEAIALGWEFAQRIYTKPELDRSKSYPEEVNEVVEEEAPKLIETLKRKVKDFFGVSETPNDDGWGN